MDCTECGTYIDPDRIKRRPRTGTCSTECTKARWTNWYIPNPLQGLGLSPGTMGAISELHVAVDLMEKGFSVFKSLSPNAIFDLIAVTENQLIRIEVKTGNIDKRTGKVHHPRVRDNNHDVLAVYTANGIQYTPEIQASSQD